MKSSIWLKSLRNRCINSGVHRPIRNTKMAPLSVMALEDRDVPSTIQGTVFNDLNANGVQDSGEPGLQGWTMFLDSNYNAIIDPGEATVTTDANGGYFFDTSSAGPDNIVGLDLQVGSGGRWVNTTPTGGAVISDVQPEAIRDFGVQFQPYQSVTPVGGETLVNTNTAGSQSGGSTSADATGNYAVAWATDNNVLARVFNSDGSARTGEIAVATNASGTPTLAMAGNGEFMVTWSSYNSSLGAWSTLARLYAADGTALGNTITVAAASAKASNFNIGVAADATGHFAVLYGSCARVTQSYDIVPTLTVQRYSPSGASNGSAISVYKATLINGNRSIAMDGAGNFVVVWDGTVSTKVGKTTTTVGGVFAQRYTASGATNGSRITVDPNGGVMSNVAMNSAGKFVVTWHDGVSGPAKSDHATVFNADGSIALGPTVFATDVAITIAGVAVDEAGNAAFAWSTPQQLPIGNGSSYGLYPGEVRMSRLLADGTLEAPTIVNTTTQGDQQSTHVAPTGNGSFVVTWQGYGAGDDQGIFSQRYGSPLMAASLPAGSPSSQTLSTMAVKPLLNEAIRRWEALGVSQSALHGIDVRIADLGGSTLGLASGRTITLDDNAAGWGWFVDKTARSDSEFTTAGNQGEQNRMDLLTVLMHEMGHIIGYEHTPTPGGLMNETLAAGTRENPGTGLVTQADFWGSLIAQAQMKRQKSLFGSFLAGRE